MYAKDDFCVPISPFVFSSLSLKLFLCIDKFLCLCIEKYWNFYWSLVECNYGSCCFHLFVFAAYDGESLSTFCPPLFFLLLCCCFIILIVFDKWRPLNAQICDVVRYRIHRMKKKLEDKLNSRDTIQNFVCHSCNKR
jgi:hypothetical protein